MIEISHLTKRYGDHVAVADLSLDMAPGKIYGFLGPNGAGKSTTMNMIAGYIAATEGTIKINGFDVLKQPEEARKCIGYLPELPPLYMDMTVREYLRFVADIKKTPKDKKRQYMEEVMELTKIADVKDRLIRNLSKGYRQRVGFAQAVFGYPEAIILDEPTVGLDPKQIIEIRELIQSLGKQHTVILSSHILSEVKEVCEHIFIISKGRLVASDTTKNLMDRMSGAQEIRLLLKGGQDDIERALRQAGIFPVSLVPGSEAGCCEAVLKAEKGEDIRERVFYAFAGADIPILEMRAGGKSLEEIFLELTAAAAEPGQVDPADMASEQADASDIEPGQADPVDTASGIEPGQADSVNTASGQTGLADTVSEQSDASDTVSEQTDLADTVSEQAGSGLPMDTDDADMANISGEDDRQEAD